MASYHLSVKTVKRSEGRSATAAAAYRHACRIACHREGRVHDYRAKAGVEASVLILPDAAPAWAEDREALWNAAEAREGRRDSVVAREWELALPSELDGEGRRVLVTGFAAELVGRYGVAADVAIHAPHREGDQRNWHAHVLTTTRRLEHEGLTAKTAALDAKQTGGPEIAHMRERWAVLQNDALERQGHEARVDHRSLVAQREAALAHGDGLAAEALDRPAEAKLGPAVSAVERREQRAAEREGHEYVPVTERGALVHEARAARGLLAELARLRAELHREAHERAALARDAYGHAREEGADPIRAGLAALRAAAQRQGIGHGRVASAAEIAERLARLMGRQAPRHARDAHHAQDGPAAGLPAPAYREGHGEARRDRQGHGREREAHGTGAHEAPGAEAIKERLDALRARERPARREGHEAAAPGPEPINERLRALLARERPAAQREGPAAERDEDAHRPRHRERGHEDDGHGWGL